MIELNEAFAAQALAVLRELGLPDNAEHVNPNGGAIALGHPLGASGARLAIAAVNQLQRTRGRLALCTMCIGVGQGIAMVLEQGRLRGFQSPGTKCITAPPPGCMWISSVSEALTTRVFHFQILGVQCAAERIVPPAHVPVYRGRENSRGTVFTRS